MYFLKSRLVVQQLVPKLSWARRLRSRCPKSGHELYGEIHAQARPGQRTWPHFLIAWTCRYR